MNLLLGTEDPRYSLKTLHALHYGAQYSGVSSHGVLHITYTDSQGDIHEGNVLSVEPTGVYAHTDDGTLAADLKPARILHAEVV